MFRGALAALVVLLVVLSGAAVWGIGSHLPAATPAAASAPPEYAPDLVTHGDLYVAAGETYTIFPTPGTHSYYQAGNITVAAGGTLIISNVTLTFLSYVGTTGTAQQRLEHIYSFDDAGTVQVYNSTITTDLGIINAYAKLALTVTGNFTTWNSTLAFPGWLDATGAGADLTFNDSIVRNNPQVANASEPLVIQGDTAWAPQLNASGGATVNFFNSSFRDTYADNVNDNGMPGPAGLNTTGTIDFPSADNNITALSTPSDSANLTRDYLYYPNGFAGGEVSTIYTNPNTGNTTASVTVYYKGQAFPLPGILNFGDGVTGGFSEVPITAALVNALNAAGVLNYLNSTGGFGAGANQFAIDLTPVENNGGVSLAVLSLSLDPALSYNMAVAGAGTTFNAVDSVLDLTWSPAPSSPLSATPPYPWNSNKLLVDDGATAYLANVSSSQPLVGVFSYSAVVPDATSQVYLYRWAQFNLTGRGGVLPIDGGVLTAFYAYNSNQANNATANALNDLSTANPAIWGYVNYVDQLKGLPAYGESGRNGQAFLLLASGDLNGTSLPDGLFLGGYHINVTIPIATNNSQAFNWSVSPYPSGVAAGTGFVGSPDFGPQLTFPGYFGQLSFGTQTLTQNGTALVGSSIDDYRVLGVTSELTNTGTSPIYNYTATFTYGAAPGVLLDSVPLTNLTLAPGASTPLDVSWLVNTTVTGIFGAPDHPFFLNVTYNGGIAKFGGGTLAEVLRVTITPYVAQFAYTGVVLTGNGTVLANATVRIGQGLGVQVTLTYSGAATVTSLEAALYYQETSTKPLATESLAGLAVNTPGETVTLFFNWTVNDTTTGLRGTTFLNPFFLTLVWNGANPLIGGNTSVDSISISIAPSQLRFTSFSAPPTSLELTSTSNYFSSGTVQYNGSQDASILLYATATSGGIPILIGETTTSSNAGAFDLSWFPLSGLLSPGTTYTLMAQAVYNGVTANKTIGTASVPPSSTPVSNFLFEKFLGLPLWIWLAIAAAAIVAILAVLFISRRSAAGKLVECGECGNLIPEDATVCPKCGAEFESDLIRCSRCGSTIPADSRFCPECAAQLLGKPGEGGEDAERQGYADFTEKYRAEAKRELGENYNEGSFWDWWKRQPSYVSYSQWKQQQGQGVARSGMSAPPSGTETVPEAQASPGGRAPPPPRGGAGGAMAAPASTAPAAATPPPSSAGAAVPGAAAGGSLKPCPNCGKEIPPEYLVCPFCGSVTQ
jgi:RNA polymerase subunit RPABC4/transcription elongation factor Spt4